MSMPTYTCCESHATISPPVRSASAMPSALLPDAVGPSTATKRSFEPSGTAEAPLDLSQRQAQQHGAPVRAVRAEIDGVQLAQQRERLGPTQHVAGAHDAVAGDGRQQVVDAIQLALAQRRAVREVAEQLADQRLRVG